MKMRMVFLFHQFKIRQQVVSAIMVFVVNDIPLWNIAAKRLVHIPMKEKTLVIFRASVIPIRRDTKPNAVVHDNRLPFAINAFIHASPKSKLAIRVVESAR